MTKNVLFVLSGNCRTFVDCFDSLYNHIISKLFSNEFTVHLYLYLKLTDPGPKGQVGWNFEYKDLDLDMVTNDINEIKKKYSSLNIEYKLMKTNEISDDDLFSQVKDRTLYIDFLLEDSKLIRSMHCHYNFECCGKYILEKEKSSQIKFENIIFVRPDLFFEESCGNIESYDNTIVTTDPAKCDHIALIPRNLLDSFFFDRMQVYRNYTINNTTTRFTNSETVYLETIKCEGRFLGKYFIKRK